MFSRNKLGQAADRWQAGKISLRGVGGRLAGFVHIPAQPVSMFASAENPEIWSVLFQILMLLAGALVLGLLFERLRQSAILGYLLAGTLMGPAALDIVKADSGVPVVAELGVSLLLFAIGLEFSAKRLLRLGPIAAGGGSIQVLATLGLGAGCGLLFGLESRVAVAIGAVMALSSTACVLRLLIDRAEMDSVHGRASLGILLLQDIAVVPLVLLVTMLGGAGTPRDMVLGLAKACGLIVLLAGAFQLLSKLILPPLLKTLSLARDRELLILLAVVLAVGSACVAHMLHLSPALGAFIAGMMLAESPFATQIRSDISALRVLFITLFFASVGMLGDPVWMWQNAGKILLVVGLIVLGKTVVITLTALLFRIPLRHAIATGACLAQVGEFGVVIAGIGHEKLFAEPVFRLLVSSTLLTLFITPFLVRYAQSMGRGVERLLPRRGSRAPSDDADAEPAAGRSDHVIVVGFGPSGQAVGEELARKNRDAIVLDMRHPNIDLARSMGFDAALGDATNVEVLLHHGIAHAKAIVVTVPDHRASVQIVNSVRTLAPNIAIIVRARYHPFVSELEQAGATVAVDEEHLTGNRLAAALRAVLQEG